MGMGLGLGGAYRDDGTDAAIKKAALDTAADGAQRATGAGLVAQPRIANRDDNIAAVILAVAADVNADVIVLGDHRKPSAPFLIEGLELLVGVVGVDRGVDRLEVARDLLALAARDVLQ
jgi:hypothetical protein